MSVIEELQITPYINAHDTYTVYGGSRMSARTLEDMRQIAAVFVDMDELQLRLGQAAAQLTKNEDAFFTNGSAGALTTAAAVCICRGDPFVFARLPAVTKDAPDEIIQLHCQHNAYDKAVEAAGAKIVEIGDADETLEFDLDGRITERTAAVFYYASSLYARGSLPLEQVIETAHRRGVPVVVDAAAQLPPVENLWRYTQAGADMVIFSGGKTLCGPQDSGLILGKREWIDLCRRFGSPNHGVCRECKTSREAMVGLYSALRQYVELDHEENRHRLLERIGRIAVRLEQLEQVQLETVHHGPVGQDYPRLFIHLASPAQAQAVHRAMRARHIYIGLEGAAVYVSPLNLTDGEADTVAAQLTETICESM